MKKILMILAMLLSVGTQADLPTGEKEVVTLTAKNTLVLNSEVNGESVSAVILKLRELNKSSIFNTISDKSEDPIYLFLNTPGGDIQAGSELIEALLGSDRKVNTVTLFAASMGFQIVQNLGDRLILQRGILMSHRATGQLQGSFGGQAPSQLDNRYAMWLNQITEMDTLTVKRTKGKQTLESYQKAYANELWLSGLQSIKGGYADRIVNIKCDDTLSGTTTHSISVLGLININYDMDNCPINTNPTNIKAEIAVIKKHDKINNSKMILEDFLNSNGGFGPSCLYNNTNEICAADPTISLRDVKDALEKFKDGMTNKKDHIIRMHF